MTHHTHPPFMSNTPRITTISSGWDGIHDDNHCWKKRASSNWSPIHSPKKLKLLALVQAIGLWLKKGGTKRPKFGNVCMCPCIFGDWYFWATLMLLLAFLEAMQPRWWLLVASRFQRAKSDPLRWFFLCSVVCFKHCQWNTIQLDPSARAQWKIELGFRATGWCPNDAAVLCFWRQPAAESPQVYHDIRLHDYRSSFLRTSGWIQGCWIWLTLLLVCPRFMACEIIYIYIPVRQLVCCTLTYQSQVPVP